MKTVDFKIEDLLDIKLWEKSDVVRLYLTIRGVSKYQHRRGIYIEFKNGKWIGTSVAKDYMQELILLLNTLTLEQIKKILKEGSIKINNLKDKKC